MRGNQKHEGITGVVRVDKHATWIKVKLLHEPEYAVLFEHVKVPLTNNNDIICIFIQGSDSYVVGGFINNNAPVWCHFPGFRGSAYFAALFAFSYRQDLVAVAFNRPIWAAYNKRVTLRGICNCSWYKKIRQKPAEGKALLLKKRKTSVERLNAQEVSICANK